MNYLKITDYVFIYLQYILFFKRNFLEVCGTSSLLKIKFLLIKFYEYCRCNINLNNKIIF